MKKFLFALLWTFVSTFGFTKVFAQVQVNVQDLIAIKFDNICMIATNNAPVSLTLSTSVAGMSVDPVSNSSMFLRATSVVSSGTTRRITTRIANGKVPAGTILTLLPVSCTATNSDGDLGTAITIPVVLNGSDQTLIDGIASCYTGNGYTDGYNINFTWKPDTSNYYLINTTKDPITITVTFTIVTNP